MKINAINGLSSYLASQPANTKETPYLIELKIDDEGDFEALKKTLNDTADRYVCLDLSNSKIETIPEEAFYTTGKGCGCDTLTGITIPDSVTVIRPYAFQSCTNLTSVTFLGTIPSTGFGNNESLLPSFMQRELSGRLKEVKKEFKFNSFNGDLREKFYATDPVNGTPGTYTTTAPVYIYSSVWTKQP